MQQSVLLADVNLLQGTHTQCCKLPSTCTANIIPTSCLGIKDCNSSTASGETVAGAVLKPLTSCHTNYEKSRANSQMASSGNTLFLIADSKHEQIFIIDKID